MLVSDFLPTTASRVSQLYWYAPDMNNMNVTLAMIAAMAENRVIGIENRLPWRLPADLKHFKAMTLGKPVIMGRNTWDSIGRPLPGRLNIVVSRQQGLQLEGAEVFDSLEAAIERATEWACEQGVDEVMIIGGAQLYQQAQPQARRMYLTRVSLSLLGDAWFPEPDTDWQRVSSEEHPEEGETPAYAFEVWER